MRYKSKGDEYVTVLGYLTPGTSVTIMMIDMTNGADSLLSLTSDVCTESLHKPGVFYWNTSNLEEQPTTYTEIAYVMIGSDGEEYGGKIVLGGVPDDVEFLKDGMMGSWQIQDYHLIMYDPQGNIIRRLALYDRNGNPTETAVYSRIIVD